MIETETEFRNRLIAYASANDPLTPFGAAVRELAARITPDCLIEEIEMPRHPLDKTLLITLPGFEIEAEGRRAFDEIARNYLPIAYRCTFEFASHPETDASFRERVLCVSRAEDQAAISIAAGYGLDALGREYGMRRRGVAP